MKKLILALCLVLFAMSVRAEEFKTIDEALAAAKKDNKHVFLYFGATWCPPCKVMKQVFKDDEVKKKLDKMPYVMIDIDENKQLMKQYGVKSIPDYMILKPDGKVLKRAKGSMGKEKFSGWLGG